MRWLKISLISIAGIFLFAILVIASYLLILDQNEYKQFIINNVDRFTDSTLVINGPVDITISTSPTLSITQFELKDNAGRYFANIQKFELQIDLIALFKKTLLIEHLVVEDADVIISKATSPGKSTGATSGSTSGSRGILLYPVLKMVELKNISINHQVPDTTEKINALLEHLTIKAPTINSPIRIEGKALINNNSIEVLGELGTIKNAVLAEQAYPLSLKISHGHDTISINGMIDNITNGRGIDIKVDAFSPDTSQLAQYSTLLPPLKGEFKIHATLHGKFPNISSNDIDTTLVYKDTISLQATGGVTDIFTQKGLDINFSGFVNDEDLISKYLPDGFPRLSKIKASAKFSKANDIFYVKQFSAQGSNTRGLRSSIQGSTGIRFDDSPQPFPDLNLLAKFESPTTREIKYFVFDDVPEIGSAKGEVRLFSHPKKDLGLDGLNIRIANKKLRLDIKGGIARMPLDPDIANSGMELEMDLEAQSTSAVASILDYPLPELGTIKLKGIFSGSKLASAFNNTALEINNKDGIHLKATGQMKFGDFSKDTPIESTNFQLTVSSPTTAAIGVLIKTSLPELGSVAATAQLTGGGSVFSLTDIEAITGQKNELQMSATGDIQSIKFIPKMSLQDIKLQLNAKADSIQMLEAFTDGPLPDLGPFELNALLQGSSNKMGLANVNLEAGSSEIVSLQATGELIELDLNSPVELNAKLVIPDLSVFGKKLDQQLPAVGPLVATGELKGGKKSGTFTGQIKLGNTQIDSKLAISIRGERPSIKGTITSPVIYLKDLGLTPVQKHEENDEKTEQVEQTTKEKKPATTKATLFSREPIEFKEMKTIDLSIDLDIDEIKGSQYNINSVNINSSLTNGHLIIGPGSIVFKKGTLTFYTDLNTQDGLKLSTNFTAKDIDVGSLVKEITARVPVEGTANLFIDLKTHGRSQHELASHLNGKVELIAENAKVLQKHVDLLLVDLIGWALTSTAKSKGRTSIDCTIVRFSIEDGLLQSNALFATGPSMAVGGEATIDLSKETIDMILHPENKQKRWSKATPIKIRGPLLNPTFTAVPYTAVATEYAGYVLLPQVYVPLRLFEYTKGLVIRGEGEQKAHPCLDVTLPSGEKAIKQHSENQDTEQ